MGPQVSFPQTNILVSVVVPTYGRPERLRHLLDQLMKQDFPRESFEVIVVDDGSPDPVCPSLLPFHDEANNNFRCLQKPNGGPASARNYGARLARGEYLVFVDDDMEVAPTFLKGHLETQKEHGPAIVFCQFDWEVDAHPEPFRRWYRDRVAAWVEGRALDATSVAQDVFSVSSPSATTANLSLLKSDFDEVGGFDIEYPFGCEDQDLGARLGRKGLRILSTAKTIARHIETHNTLERVCSRQQRGAIDTVRFIRRFAVEYHCGRPAIAIANDPVHFGKDSASLVAKKMIRSFLTLTAPAVFAGVRILEWIAPNSQLLQKAYDVIIAAYVQKGWREGLKKYALVRPLEDWAPVGSR